MANYNVYESGKNTFYAYVQDIKIEFERKEQDYILSIIDNFINKIKETKNTSCMEIYLKDKTVLFNDFDSDKTYVFEIKKMQNNKFKHLFFDCVAF